MMKPTYSAILSTILILNQSAFAKMPKSELFPSFSEKDESVILKALDYRNAKGESLNYPVKGEQPNQWSQLDPKKDGKAGTATESAYANPKMPKDGKNVIVAVIDSGVDINHEDLKGKIWENLAEIDGEDGVDDDGNGYVDDKNGWNFLGNSKGNIEANTLELTREFARLKLKKKTEGLSEQEAADFQKIEKQFHEEKRAVQKQLNSLSEISLAIKLLKSNGLKEETLEELAKIPDSNEEVKSAKILAEGLFNSRMRNSEGLKLAIKDNLVQINICYNENYDSSREVGDNPKDLYETGYGNGDVKGPDATHGTHVAGIIAAQRGNNMGMNGQADLVKIMSIRTVPNGDERDKDVANAIIYAVQNGAKVINMSFGKQFSPFKKAVDQAVLYAESKGVILVHASGNSGKSTETGFDNFPLKKVGQNTPFEREVKNWIEVGASAQQKDKTLPAYFSNYGKSTIDVFAPGVGIVSTVPGNQYASLNGTSMATPQVAGIMALLFSRFPLYADQEILDAVLNNTTRYPGLIVNIPCKGSDCGGQISFSELSRTGGVINTNLALEALVK